MATLYVTTMKIIPEIPLIPTPKPKDERAEAALGFEFNETAGKRHKLGGVPEFLQSEDWPSCCSNQMTFYGQLDSIGEDYNLADCGMIYVFVCFDCFSVESVLQTC